MKQWSEQAQTVGGGGGTQVEAEPGFWACTIVLCRADAPHCVKPLAWATQLEWGWESSLTGTESLPHLGSPVDNSTLGSR